MKENLKRKFFAELLGPDRPLLHHVLHAARSTLRRSGIQDLHFPGKQQIRYALTNPQNEKCFSSLIDLALCSLKNNNKRQVFFPKLGDIENYILETYFKNDETRKLDSLRLV